MGRSYYAAANARRIYPFLGGPTMPTARTPVLFIPGLWMHADSWKSWGDLFRSAGYEPTARSWPGVATTVAETRAHPETMAGRGITEIADYYAQIIGTFPAKPIVIGHSFGGLLAQKVLGRGLAAAAVALHAGPVKGGLAPPGAAPRAPRGHADDTEAVSSFACRHRAQADRRPRPLAVHRQRLARGRRHGAGLAQAAVALSAMTLRNPDAAR